MTQTKPLFPALRAAIVGILLSGGQLLAGVPTGDLNLSGITFGTDTLNFTLGDDGLCYGAGSSSIEFDGQTLTLTIPEEGLVLEEDNGTFEIVDLDAEVTADFEFYGVTLTIDEDNPLTFLFDAGDNAYSIYGALSLSVEDIEVSGFMGTSDNPGVVITDGELTSYDLGISESISLSGLTIETVGDFLGVSYSSDEVQYSVFGELSVSFEDQSFTVEAGDSSEPGLILQADSGKQLQLVSLDATVTEDISLYGLDIQTGDDGLTFVYNASDSLYEVYGEIDVEIDGESLDAILGDEDSPGLEIESGVVDSVNISLAADFDLGGFEFISPGDDSMTLTYTKDSDTYTVSGEAELDSLWDTIVDLGTTDNPGIIVTDNKWDIENFSIEIDSLDLGFAELNELKVSYSRNSKGDIEVEVDLDVSIPELEIEVAGDVVIDNGKITDIYIEFEAAGTSEGLEILDTGIDIAEMSVALDNLDQPSDLIMSGSIGLEFGGQIEIGGETVTLAYIEGDVYIDSDELRLSDTIYYGAYQEDNGDWNSVIFKGEAEIDLNWSRSLYEISGDIQLPTDYGVKIETDLEFASEEIVFSAEAKVRVPKGIPIIGGDDLGSIDAAMLIDMNDSSNSFAAGWVTINLLFTKEEAGIEYKFKGSDISYLDSGDIGDIKNEIKDAESAQETITRKYTVDVPEGATSFLMDFDWVWDPFDDGVEEDLPLPAVTMLGSGMVQNLDSGTTEASILSLHNLSYDESVQSFSAFLTDVISVLEDTNGITFSCEGLVETDPVTGEQISFLPLAEGEVTIALTYDRAYDAGLTIDTPTVAFYYGYPDPTVSIASLGTSSSNSETADGVTTLFSGTTLPIHLNAFTDPVYENDLNISIHLDNNNSGYNGTTLQKDIPYSNPNLADSVELTVDWTIENLTGNVDDEFYFYAKLNNKNQSIVYSDYMGPYRISPAIYGAVYFVSVGFPLPGLRVFLDENGNGQYDSSTDPSTITDELGGYAFDGLEDGTYTVGVVVTKGYSTTGEEENLFEVEYISGSSVTQNINLQLLDYITGSVFVDSNQNGVQDTGEVGVFGVTVYLDEDGDEIFNPGKDTFAITDIEGDWTLYAVDADSTYQVYMLAYNDQLTVGTNQFSVVTTSTVASPNSVGPPEHGRQQPQVRSMEHRAPIIGINPGAVEEITDRHYMMYSIENFDTGTSIHFKRSDPDGDGVNNKLEQILGSNPLVADGAGVDYLVDSFDGQTLSLLMDLVKSRRYEVEYSTDLVSWTSIEAFRADSTGLTLLDFELDAIPTEPVYIRITLVE